MKTAKEIWEDLKKETNICSGAMESLLIMTGIEKVKLACVSLFKCGLALKKMTPEGRSNNGISVNQVFLGNPG